MPHLIITLPAQRSIDRCRRFLKPKSEQAGRRAVETIRTYLRALETTPDIGRPEPSRPRFRELVIPFGDSGYMALYHYDQSVDAVFVLAFRHQREDSY